jgi:arsenate reductase-like glutaredoxin family protein
MDKSINNIDISQLEKQLYTLRISLQTLDEDKLNEIMKQQDLISLKYELCNTIKLFVSSPYQKIDEFIEHQQRLQLDPKSNVIVSDATHGADFIDTVTGGKEEIKTSTILKKNNSYRCNINWNIPASKILDERRDLLIKSINKKTIENGATFIIKNHASVEIKRYHFSNMFLIEYFKRIPIKESTKTYNFGCRQCQTCKSFHRLDKLKHFEDNILKNNPTKEQWDTLLSKTDSKCK